eukprot:Skav216237  [mRNA]  locus=scaffold5243:78864:79412:- [translate_table: standard]
MSSSDRDLVEEVTVRLAGLELIITARRVSSEAWVAVGSSETGSAAAEPDLGLGTEVYHDPHQITRQLEDQALRATTASECGALPLPFLRHLALRLGLLIQFGLPPDRQSISRRSCCSETPGRCLLRRCLPITPFQEQLLHLFEKPWQFARILNCKLFPVQRSSRNRRRVPPGLCISQFPNAG